ncbi:MAG: T9SS type A sorting domain-containing protein [Bacteroidales bacterium]|nr:T9SS type A sorting domain-containing protein [Bacteroidales bacterium]
MNKILTYTFCAVLISNAVFGDVIPDDSHYVEKCALITNVDEFPSVTFIGHVNNLVGDDYNYVISSESCLEKGYKFNTLDIYAVHNAYIDGKDINEINLSADRNAVKADINIEPYTGYYHDSIPISEIDEYYKVMGFTDSNLVLHMWKKVTKYSDGQTNLVELYDYPGDIASLSYNIPTYNFNNNYYSEINIFPNPANLFIECQITNEFSGEITLEVFNTESKKIQSLCFEKHSEIENYKIPMNNVSSGIYYVQVSYGGMTDIRKIIVEQ